MSRRRHEHRVLTVEPLSPGRWAVVLHRAPTGIDRARAHFAGHPAAPRRNLLQEYPSRDWALEVHPDAILLDHPSRPGEPFEGRL